MKDEIWPAWQDTLTSLETGLKPIIEGGSRITGHLKNDTAEMPLVSYVTVVRNNEMTLARTIESVISQTYPNVEHIVLDGNSSDGTLGIIMDYANRLDYYASAADAGLYDALNKAIPLCRGSLICVLNSDDWLEPDAAMKIVRAAQGLPPSALILSAAQVETGTQLTIWRPTRISLTSYFTCANCCHNAIYATRTAYEASGPYDTSYKIAADFKWIMTCHDAGATFLFSDTPTVNYSLGGISGDGKQHRHECLRLIRERFPYLTAQEATVLHCSYYFWRERIEASELATTIRPIQFITEIRMKYPEKSDLLEALDLAALPGVGGFRRFKTTLRRVLTNYPRTFAFIYGLYTMILRRRRRI